MTTSAPVTRLNSTSEHKEKEILVLLRLGIRDPDIKGPGIADQKTVLPDRMETSPGITDQRMVLPDRKETPPISKIQE